MLTFYSMPTFLVTITTGVYLHFVDKERIHDHKIITHKIMERSYLLSTNDRTTSLCLLPCNYTRFLDFGEIILTD